MDYLFNFTFTRPDEDDAHVYHVGMHVTAPDYATAERLLRERNDHLTLREITLFAVFTDDGERLRALHFPHYHGGMTFHFKDREPVGLEVGNMSFPRNIGVFADVPTFLTRWFVAQCIKSIRKERKH